MKPAILKTFIAAATLSLVTAFGCGGANLGGTTNLFYGTYTGTFTETGQAGGIASPFTIDVNGNVNGTLANANGTTTIGYVSGIAQQVGTSENGTFTGTYTPNGGNAITIAGGALSWITSNSASILQFSFIENGVTFTILLTPQPTNKARPH
jgi:hypothetical protein